MSVVLKNIRFNSDGGCFSIATEHGFWVYNTYPTAEITHRDIGGLSLAVMLDRSNIIALVGGGARPFSAPNTVTIWDDNKQRAVAEIDSKTPVLNVLFKGNRLVVVLEHLITVYSFPNLTQLQQLDTNINPRGLASLTTAVTVSLLAIPGLQEGQVHVVDVDHRRPRAPVMFQAHKHDLARLTISSSGRKVATASIRGTIVRVFNGSSGEQLCEFRRGLTPAEISGLVFSRDSSLLCANSDRTAHLFHLEQLELNATVSWTAKVGEYLPGMAGMTQQYRSFAQLELHRPSTCGFTKDNTSLMAIGQHGAAYRYGFSQRGRDVTKDKFVTLFKPRYGDMFRLKRTVEARDKTPEASEASDLGEGASDTVAVQPASEPTTSPPVFLPDTPTLSSELSGLVLPTEGDDVPFEQTAFNPVMAVDTPSEQAISHENVDLVADMRSLAVNDDTALLEAQALDALALDTGADDAEVISGQTLPVDELQAEFEDGNDAIGDNDAIDDNDDAADDSNDVFMTATATDLPTSVSVEDQSNLDFDFKSAALAGLGETAVTSEEFVEELRRPQNLDMSRDESERFQNDDTEDDNPDNSDDIDDGGRGGDDDDDDDDVIDDASAFDSSCANVAESDDQSLYLFIHMQLLKADESLLQVIATRLFDGPVERRCWLCISDRHLHVLMDGINKSIADFSALYSIVLLTLKAVTRLTNGQGVSLAWRSSEHGREESHTLQLITGDPAVTQHVLSGILAACKQADVVEPPIVPVNAMHKAAMAAFLDEHEMHPELAGYFCCYGSLQEDEAIKLGRTQIIKREAVLVKKEGIVSTSWKRYMFILRGQQLIQMSSANDAVAKTTFDVNAQSFSCGAASEPEHPFAFKCGYPNEPLVLATQSRPEALSWLRCLTQTPGTMLDNGLIAAPIQDGRRLVATSLLLTGEQLLLCTENHATNQLEVIQDEDVEDLDHARMLGTHELLLLFEAGDDDEEEDADKEGPNCMHLVFGTTYGRQQAVQAINKVYHRTYEVDLRCEA
eukprot:m.138202 g.138202  ORF g.138202 m.138202 type:complete len:1017 (+) comp16065_c2_seq2:95-3145(+)